jgi:hypothetical protein
MLFDNTKYQTWFIIGFAVCNIILISTLYWIAQDVKSGYSHIPVFNVGDVIVIILGFYTAITFLILLCDILGKKPDMDKNNLFFYGLKSALILSVVFYDGVILLDTPHTFFQDISNTGSESSLLKGIALSSVTLFFGLLFTRKPIELKINYKICE